MSRVAPPPTLVRFRHGLLAAAVLTSIIYLVLGVRPQVPAPLAGVSDIVLHGCGYLVLAVLAALASLAYGVARAAPVAFAVSVAHGALLELAQVFVPTRTAEVKDLVVDAVGALAGVLLVRWLVAR